jgi:hypothetical protein
MYAIYAIFTATTRNSKPSVYAPYRNNGRFDRLCIAVLRAIRGN